MTNIQLKGHNPGDPWLVVDGSPSELLDQLLQVFPDIDADPSDLTGLPEVVAKARDSWASRVATGGSVANVQQAFQATPVQVPGNTAQQNGYVPQQAGPTSPAPSAPVPQAQAAPTPQVETDRWGNSYEHGHPKAPMTPLGTPAVLRRATSQAGKPYAQWIDPRNKAIPSVYAVQKVNPPDMWSGEFARGV